MGAWTSQHPWLEHVPEPFVFTVDPRNLSSVGRAFTMIRAAFESSSSAASSTAGSRPELERFYSLGEYPNRDAYSIGGFLGRVADVVRKTRPLQHDDWAWERQRRPEQLPKERRM